MRGSEHCTESKLNYIVSAPLKVDVLDEVKKRRKIAATTNDSKKVDVSAAKESEKGNISAKKGGTSADPNKGNVSGRAFFTPGTHLLDVQSYGWCYKQFKIK